MTVTKNEIVDALRGECNGYQRVVLADRIEAEGIGSGEPVAYRIFDGEGDYDYRTELPGADSIAWSARYGRKWEPLYAASPSIDQLIAEIDELLTECPLLYTTKLTAPKLKTILDKYRSTE